MARLRPLALLLVVLVFATGLAAIAYVGVREGRIADTPTTRSLGNLFEPLAIAAGATLAFQILFRAGARRLLRRSAERDLRSLGALETVAVIVVVVFLVAVTFGSFTGTLLSLGLVGFGLTLALQRPILAVGGWLAIIFTRLFRVGDRIEVDKIHGDVVEIHLFNTRLWEVSPDTGRPTGRIVSIANAVFLEKPVANATADAPFVFDEFAVLVAYGSDLRAAEHLLRAAGAEVLDAEGMVRMAEQYEAQVESMPIEAVFPRGPTVVVALLPNGVELRLRYLVDARQRSAMRTALSETWIKVLGERAGEAVPHVVS